MNIHGDNNKKYNIGLWSNTARKCSCSRDKVKNGRHFNKTYIGFVIIINNYLMVMLLSTGALGKNNLRFLGQIVKLCPTLNKNKNIIFK